MRTLLVACREPTGDQNRPPKVRCIFFKHKRFNPCAIYTRIVVFWHISNIPQMIPWSQICYNNAMSYLAATFVKVVAQLAVGCSDLWAFVRCSGCSTPGKNCETGLFMYITVSQKILTLPISSDLTYFVYHLTDVCHDFKTKYWHIFHIVHCNILWSMSTRQSISKRDIPSWYVSYRTVWYPYFLSLTGKRFQLDWSQMTCRCC